MVRPWKFDQLGLVGLVACLQALVPEAGGYFGLASSKDELITVALNKVDNYQPDTSVPRQVVCDTLLTTETQQKMCRRQGISEVLVEAARLSVVECQQQYTMSRWNCSLAARHRLNTLSKGFKETAFMYAISSAGLVHAFARACSRGQLDRCSCDDSYSPSKNKQTWMWGGCGDNIKYARKFTRRFLRSQNSQDLRAQVDKHNTHVGITEVQRKVTRSCKCHGVSGSCTVKTCWRQLINFSEVGRVLKKKAVGAKQVSSAENAAQGRIPLKPRAPNRRGRRRKDSSAQAQQRHRNRNRNDGGSAQPQRRHRNRKNELLFMEEPPAEIQTFCERSDYSLGTRGRQCEKRNKNCQILCCGRGYNTFSKTVTKPCECKVIWCCEVKCKACQLQEEYYQCK